MQMWEYFEDTWDGQPRRKTTSTHRTELTSDGVRPVHSAPYQAGPAARQLVANEIDRILIENIIELAKTDWASPIVSALNKDGSLRLYVDYRRLRAVTVR